MAGQIASAVWSRIRMLPTQRQQIAEVSRQFEALLIEHLLQMMRPAGQEEPQGAGGEPQTYMEMAEQAMAQALAERGGLGIARLLQRGLEGPKGTDWKSSADKQNEANSGRPVR